MQMSCSVIWYIVRAMSHNIRSQNFNIVPNVERVLMSDTLRGQVPSLEEHDNDIEHMQLKHVVVVADKHVGANRSGLIGILRKIELGIETKIEIRIDLSEALDVIEAAGLFFGGFELCHGEERIVKIPGPYIVKCANICDISVPDQLCTLGLDLVKQAR